MEIQPFTPHSMYPEFDRKVYALAFTAVTDDTMARRDKATEQLGERCVELYGEDGWKVALQVIRFVIAQKDSGVFDV